MDLTFRFRYNVSSGEIASTRELVLELPNAEKVNGNVESVSKRDVPSRPPPDFVA